MGYQGVQEDKRGSVGWMDMMAVMGGEAGYRAVQEDKEEPVGWMDMMGYQEDWSVRMAILEGTEARMESEERQGMSGAAAGQRAGSRSPEKHIREDSLAGLLRRWGGWGKREGRLGCRGLWKGLPAARSPRPALHGRGGIPWADGCRRIGACDHTSYCNHDAFRASGMLSTVLSYTDTLHAGQHDRCEVVLVQQNDQWQRVRSWSTDRCQRPSCSVPI